MCGLVGMFGRAYDQDKKALRNLLHFDTFRGEHSTGLAVIDDNNKIEVYKKVGMPYELFNSFPDVFDQKTFAYKKAGGRVFLGHNRYATKGKITDENAHPFHHLSVVGAHNGTLTSVSTLEDGNKFEVDSEAIFYNLDKYDVKDTISNIWGAYALTWYDAIEERVFVIRNKERPLYYTRRTDKDVMYYASEQWMLQAALKYAKISHGDICEFKEDTLYSFDMSDWKDTAEFRSRVWEIEENVFGYKPPPPKPRVVVKNNGTYSIRHGGATSNNPFGKSSNNSFQNSKEDEGHFKKLRSMQGKDIEFRFNAIKEGYKKVKYFEAYPDDPLVGFDIRIFPSAVANKEKWDSWERKAHKQTFKGTVKRAVKNYINGRTELYLLIDNRSIVECEDKGGFGQDSIPFDSGELYEGFNGRYLNQTEWEKCTQNGCEGCGQPALASDNDLRFIEDDRFLCGLCCGIGGEFRSLVPIIH